MWFPREGQKWLKLEPARLAPIGGLFFATCTMLLYLVRLLLGYSIEPQTIVVGVATTFLVSYGGTGFYVWYLLRKAEIALDQPAEKRHHGLGHDKPDYHDESHGGEHDAAQFEDHP